MLLNLELRHKTDKVFYDQRKYDLEKELSYLRKQLAIFLREGHEIGESEDRTSKVYEKLAHELEAEREEREAHVRNLEAMIEEKLQLLQVNQAREADLYEIAERAIQDKDLNEKNWRKIFLTHVFVNRMLRNKIEKEMDKFRIVEFAFKEIKTSTVPLASPRASTTRRPSSTSTSTRRPSTASYSARSPTTRRPSSTSRTKPKPSSTTPRGWRWSWKSCSPSKSSRRTCTVLLLARRPDPRARAV